MFTRRQILQFATAGVAAAAADLPSAFAQSNPSNAALPQDVSGSHSLRAHAATRGVLVGCAVAPALLANNSQYARLVAAQASILVPENAMKWAALRPAPDKFDFAGGDAIVAFAQANDQKVRGHNLCWHEALPGWFASTVTKDNARQILTGHIQTVVSRYAGKIHSWDVVNEAIDPAGTRPDGLRDSPWLQLAGDDYIELAFRTARQADPAALLAYNDYGIELDAAKQTQKREHVLALVKRLHDNGKVIDAVGVQSHLGSGDTITGNVDGLRDFVSELRGMGLQVFVTELDVNERASQGTVDERDAQVAAIYRDYLTMMLAEPNVAAVLTWGITDRYTWLNGAKYARADGQPQRPLPFDADYNATAAFFAERDAFDSRKKT